VKLTRCYR